MHLNKYSDYVTRLIGILPLSLEWRSWFERLPRDQRGAAAAQILADCSASDTVLDEFSLIDQSICEVCRRHEQAIRAGAIMSCEESRRVSKADLDRASDVSTGRSYLTLKHLSAQIDVLDRDILRVARAYLDIANLATTIRLVSPHSFSTHEHPAFHSISAQ